MFEPSKEWTLRERLAADLQIYMRVSKRQEPFSSKEVLALLDIQTKLIKGKASSLEKNRARILAAANEGKFA